MRGGRIINSGLLRAGLQLSRAGTVVPFPQYAELCSRVHDMMMDQLPSVPETTGRRELLAHLQGTDVVAAMYLLENLHTSLAHGGDVCEFGVAQGATSALVANELLVHFDDRYLWLYDSFEGLPRPTEKDELIDDIFGLGSMDAYTGEMSVPQETVVARLADVGWQRTRIVPGYVDATTNQLPDRIGFAYVDFDLYEPIRDALGLIAPRLVHQGRIMVDDYGRFSSGVQAAVDEFVAGSKFQAAHSPAGAGPFVTLSRSASPSERGHA